MAQTPTTDVQLWHWVAFGAFVAVLLVLDLFVFHRDSHEPTLRESAVWTVIWCSLALAFNVLLWIWRGSDIGVAFLTGYLVEWALSMDNVFVFAVVFSFFGVPLKYQYRVLFWGILGAVVMRLAFILAGAALIERFSWVMPIFGALLIYTGYKLAAHGDTEVNPEKNILMRAARRLFPVAKESHGDHFFVIEDGRRCITPLFLVLLVVESTDVLFAVDSVPAIFGITQDAFTVFTSNIFAILGLRALYFLLAGVMNMFRYLNYGLAAVLSFVGFKMVGEWWTGHHLLPPAGSLAVILVLLSASIIASILANRRERLTPPPLSESDTPQPDATQPVSEGGRSQR
ncbi:MAG: TerC family protein [Planctomycetota bacterium]|nr:MAG: TerC family protein [Planctomycetota bacterium]